MASIKNIALLKSGYDHLLNYLNKNSLKQEILEPMYVIITLSILSFKPKNTKIAIYDNLIHIQSSNVSQGLIRSLRGNNREEICFLFRPLIRFTEIYNLNELDDKKKKYVFIYLTSLSLV